MTLDLGTLPLTLLTYRGTPIAPLTKVGSNLTSTFKGDPNIEKQHFSPNLTSDDPWPWYVTLALTSLPYERIPIASLTQIWL